jgi:hypothetical protein
MRLTPRLPVTVAVYSNNSSTIAFTHIIAPRFHKLEVGARV